MILIKKTTLQIRILRYLGSSENNANTDTNKDFKTKLSFIIQCFQNELNVLDPTFSVYRPYYY